MLEVTITKHFIESMCIVIVVDLSKPAGLLDLLVHWLDAIRKRVDDVLKELKANEDIIILEKIKNRAALALPENHPDKSTIRPIGIPLLILGTKYDIYQNFEV